MSWRAGVQLFEELVPLLDKYLVGEEKQPFLRDLIGLFKTYDMDSAELEGLTSEIDQILGIETEEEPEEDIVDEGVREYEVPDKLVDLDLREMIDEFYDCVSNDFDQKLARLLLGLESMDGELLVSGSVEIKNGLELPDLSIPRNLLLGIYVALSRDNDHTTHILNFVAGEDCQYDHKVESKGGTWRVQPNTEMTLERFFKKNKR